MSLFCSIGNFRFFFPQERNSLVLSFGHIISPLLTKLVRSKMAGYWPGSSSRSIKTLKRTIKRKKKNLVHKNAKKELGQCPAILTSCLVNNAYTLTQCFRQSCVASRKKKMPHEHVLIVTTRLCLLPFSGDEVANKASTESK